MNAPFVPEAAAGDGPMLSPVDLPGEPFEPEALGWAARIVATASLFLMLFNSGAIRGWADELPPAPLTEPVVAAAERWHGAASALGLDVPLEAMRRRWREAQDARFERQR